MVVHPSPPTDVPSLIEAYRHELTSLVNTCDGLRGSEWDVPTQCPGWTVHDHVAHVVHLEDYLSGSDHPAGGEDIRVGDPEHVRNDFGVWIEQGVRARRSVPPEALLAELRTLVEVRTANLYDLDPQLETPVRHVMDQETTFEELARLRLCDVWTHEQDIRHAVDRPGSLDGPGAAQWMSWVLGALPRVVLRRVRPEPGTTVIVESTGPVTGRAGVRIDVDSDGEPVAHELFSGHAESTEDGHGVHDESTPEQVTTISLSTDSLARRAAGRVSTQDTAYQVHGDEDLAARVLDALTLTP
jgi:uncharacterized protein (TIGR03083 family)